MGAYEYFDRKVIREKDDYTANFAIPQLTNREYKIFNFLLEQIKKKNDPKQYEAFDVFVTSLLNSNIPTFSNAYQAEKLWKQEKRLTRIKEIFKNMADTYLPNSVWGRKDASRINSGKKRKH